MPSPSLSVSHRPGSALAALALVLMLGACGKKADDTGSTPGSTAPAPVQGTAASPPAAASSTASGTTNNGGLPASQLGSIAPSGGSKNSSPNNSTGNAAR